MMSQQLLKAVKRLSTLEKSCASCLQMAKAVKLSPVGKCTTYLKLVWKRFDKILISLLLNRIPNFSSCWSDRMNVKRTLLFFSKWHLWKSTWCCGRIINVFKLLRYGQKAKLFLRLCAQGLVNILKLKFRRDLEAEVLLLMLGWGYEVESWSRFWSFVRSRF